MSSVESGKGKRTPFGEGVTIEGRSHILDLRSHALELISLLADPLFEFPLLPNRHRLDSSSPRTPLCPASLSVFACAASAARHAPCPPPARRPTGLSRSHGGREGNRMRWSV